jgi:hypothetical protein
MNLTKFFWWEAVWSVECGEGRGERGEGRGERGEGS